MHRLKTVYLKAKFTRECGGKCA